MIGAFPVVACLFALLTFDPNEQARNGAAKQVLVFSVSSHFPSRSHERLTAYLPRTFCHLYPPILTFDPELGARSLPSAHVFSHIESPVVDVVRLLLCAERWTGDASMDSQIVTLHSLSLV